MTTAAAPFLVVGLGNPGSSYAATRHNIGEMVIAELLSRATPVPLSLSVHKKSGTDIAQTRRGDHQVIYATTRSYMNLTGGPVKALAQFFSIPPTQIIAIHDELDIDFGQVRLKRGGGEGGHNGLRSLSSSLGTKDYLRVRVGIGRPPGRMDAATFVLKPFATPERSELPFLLGDAADAVELLIDHGLDTAQNQIHSR